MWLIIAVLLTFVLILGYWMDHSPMGYEDDSGWHPGEPEKRNENAPAHHRGQA